MSDDLREAIEKAIDTPDGDDGGAPAGDSAPAAAPPPATPPPPPKASAEQLPAAGEQKGELKDDAPAQPTDKPAPAAPAPAAAPHKPPVSLKPEARAEWDKVPPLVQAEIVRRDREVSEALRTSADARHSPAAAEGEC